jgi:hypothetical protein
MKTWTKCRGRDCSFEGTEDAVLDHTIYMIGVVQDPDHRDLQFNEDAGEYEPPWDES